MFLLFSILFFRFMGISICKCCAFHIWYFFILILIRRKKEDAEWGENTRNGNTFTKQETVLNQFEFNLDRCEWVRNWRVWKYVIDYFPIDLVKTVDLPANRNYLIGTCPHGILWYEINSIQILF